jgi:hypothetical protein
MKCFKTADFHEKNYTAGPIMIGKNWTSKSVLLIVALITAHTVSSSSGQGVSFMVGAPVARNAHELARRGFVAAQEVDLYPGSQIAVPQSDGSYICDVVLDTYQGKGMFHLWTLAGDRLGKQYIPSIVFTHPLWALVPNPGTRELVRTYARELRQQLLSRFISSL